MMPSTESHFGKVITFYSYKGGTGRTMALANIACVLAEREVTKKGILVVDWDLEAPGLHRFFSLSRRQPFSSKREKKFESATGLIDLFVTINNNVEKHQGSSEELQTEEKAKLLIDRINIDKYIQKTEIKNISIMKAGNFDDTYAERVNSFEWEELYQKSPWIFRVFAEKLASIYDYVLIDSRTGITDTAGICTMIVPEKLVVVTIPNKQSLTGITSLVKQAVEYRKASDDLRPLMVFPLPSRIDADQPDLRQKWRRGSTRDGIVGYQDEFENLLKEAYSLPVCDLDDYFDEVQIQHVPYYAYGEKIATLYESNEDSLSIVKSYKNFTERLILDTGPWAKVKEQTSIEEQVKEYPNFLVPAISSLSNSFDKVGNQAASFLRIITLLVSSIGFGIAMLSGAYVSIMLIGFDQVQVLDNIFPILMVIGVTYGISWIVALVGIRLFYNLVLPYVMNLYAWGTLAGILILYSAILQKIYGQEYYLNNFIKYVSVMAVAFAALLGFHLLIENHSLLPFSVPLLMFNLGHLFLIVFRYIYTPTVKYEYLTADILFFFGMTAISVFMMIHIGVLKGVRTRIGDLFKKVDKGNGK